MKIVLSHPTSNANVRAVADGFLTNGMLQKFHTSIALFPDTYLYSLGKLKALKELRRRTFDIGLKQNTSTFPFWETMRILLSKIKAEKLLMHETGMFSTDRCFHEFDKHVAKNLNITSDAIYAYEDSALLSFTNAQRLGLKCIYDLPIAYWETARRLMYEEAERLPLWAKTLAGGLSDSNEKLDRKTRELELADCIVVPSKFVEDSIPEWAQKKKIIRAPFGSPAAHCNIDIKKENLKQQSNRPLRILFCGSMGQRKGLGDLFSAIKLLKGLNVELVVMGSLQAPMEFYKKELPQFTYEPGRPHQEVLELMRTCDVFCLPSIVEGRALVMQEAMSQGLPLIITPNTGGEDLIIEGENGFLVPIRSPEAIANKINWFIDNRTKIADMGEQAINHARKYTWESYSKQICEGINSKFDL